jgi:hypothetical protein
MSTEIKECRTDSKGTNYNGQKSTTISGIVCQFYDYYTIILKSDKTIWIFHGKCVDEGDNPVDNPNIYNIKGDNRLSLGLTSR